MLIVPDLSKSMVIRENCGLHSLTTNLVCCCVKSGYGLKGPVTLSRIPHRYRPRFHIWKVRAKDPVQIVGGNVEKASDLWMRHGHLSG